MDVVQVKESDRTEVAALQMEPEVAWVLVMVPEAEYLSWRSAYCLAHERDKEAAEQLRLDFERWQEGAT